jgi:hypothetical protein
MAAAVIGSFAIQEITQNEIENMNELAFLVAGLALALASQSVSAATFLVATNGNDANPGTEATPFAMIERARDEIRQRKSTGSLPAGGIVVEVRGGTYESARSHELTDQDRCGWQKLHRG